MKVSNIESIQGKAMKISKTKKIQQSKQTVNPNRGGWILSQHVWNCSDLRVILLPKCCSTESGKVNPKKCRGSTGSEQHGVEKRDVIGSLTFAIDIH